MENPSYRKLALSLIHIFIWLWDEIISLKQPEPHFHGDTGKWGAGACPGCVWDNQDGEGGCGPSPGKLCLTGVWVGSVIKDVHTNKNIPGRDSLQKAQPSKAEQGSEGSSPSGTRNIYSGNIPCRQHTGLQSSCSPMTATCPYWSAFSALWPGIRTCHLTHRGIVLFCSSQLLFVYFLTPKQFFFF